MIASKQLHDEIYEYLKEKLEIPKHATELTIHLGLEGLLRIECAYFPEAKDGNSEHNAHG
jgi:hypothetical protein